MIRIAICDDDKVASRHLRDLLHRLGSLPVGFSAEIFDCPYQFHQALSEGVQYDIIFLDIEMGELSGIDIASHIRGALKDFSTILIYISSHDTYFRELIDTVPSGFIGKPVSARALEMVLHRCIPKLISSKNVFPYTTFGETHRVMHNQIIYFESVGRAMKIVTLDGEDIFYAKIEEVEKQLASPVFIRCHRSYIVNLQNMLRFSRTEIVMKKNHYVPISGPRSKDVRASILKHLEENA